MSERIALLLAYMDATIKAIARRKAELESVIKGIADESPSDHETVVLGYALHNLYCAFEDVFEETARTFENSITDQARFHAELLKRMKLEVHRVRPAFLSQEGFELANELRGFRHVFRHAYDHKLDGERVVQLARKTLDAWGTLESDAGRFRAFLLEQLGE